MPTHGMVGLRGARSSFARSGSSTSLFGKKAGGTSRDNTTSNNGNQMTRHSSNAELGANGMHYASSNAVAGGLIGSTTAGGTSALRGKGDERNKNPKIIFLDVDGVLHSIRVARQEQLFNAQKMALLKKLITSTDAQVVLSSAWRRTGPTLRMAYQMLNKHGIDTPIDITPDYGMCGKRSAEILTWVDKYQIRDWIAIDDLDLNAGEPRMRAHFIKCNPLIGLTSDLVENGVSILNQHDPR